MKLYSIDIHYKLTPALQFLDVEVRKLLKTHPFYQYNVEDRSNILTVREYTFIYIENLVLTEEEVKKVVIYKPLFSMFASMSEKKAIEANKYSVVHEELYGYIASYLYSKLNLEKFARLDEIDFTFNINSVFDSSDTTVIYTDGSFNKKTGDASWAFVSLNPKLNTNIKEECEFLHEKRSYEVCSGKIENGTNNIGELNALYYASQALVHLAYEHDVDDIIIILDSEYSANVFRFWIKQWMLNGKQYKNKTVIDNILFNCNQIVEVANKRLAFMWTKSHAGTFFNELADSAAKAEISK